jgi:TonB family protein
MVEALTQRLPAELDQRTEFAALPPPAIPEGFAGIVERCLNRDPAERLTLGDLKAQLDPPPRPPEARPNPAEAAVSAPETAVSEHSADAVSNSAVAEPVAAGPKHFEPRAPQQETLTELLVRAPGLPAQPSPIRRLAVLGLAITLAVVIAVWAAWHQRAASEGSPSRAQNLQPVSSPAPLAAPQDAPPPAPMAPAVAPPAAPAIDAAVRHEEIPVVSRHARQSIRGDIVVTVRVTVDHSGTVVNQVVENRGSSKYFARLASKAAKKWRFAAAQNSREWLLEFDFTRDGTTGHAVPQS